MSDKSQTTASKQLSEIIRKKAAEAVAAGRGQVRNAWDQHPDNQTFVVSAEEARVFDIEPERWPFMWAALEMFEEISGFCWADRLPTALVEDIVKERPDIPRDIENVEAFAEFCVSYTDLTALDAYKAWAKWHVWHLRMRYHFCPTCTDEDMSTTYQVTKIKSENEQLRSAL